MHEYNNKTLFLNEYKIQLCVLSELQLLTCDVFLLNRSTLKTSDKKKQLHTTVVNRLLIWILQLSQYELRRIDSPFRCQYCMMNLEQVEHWAAIHAAHKQSNVVEWPTIWDHLACNIILETSQSAGIKLLNPKVRRDNAVVSRISGFFRRHNYWDLVLFQ